VGVDDHMPAICWLRYYMKVQEYNARDNAIYQGKHNESSILMERKGKASKRKMFKETKSGDCGKWYQ